MPSLLSAFLPNLDAAVVTEYGSSFVPACPPTALGFLIALFPTNAPHIESNQPIIPRCAWFKRSFILAACSAFVAAIDVPSAVSIDVHRVFPKSRRSLFPSVTRSLLPVAISAFPISVPAFDPAASTALSNFALSASVFLLFPYTSAAAAKDKSKAT